MTTVLCTNAYNAARKVKQPKKHARPVLNCIYIHHHEGRLALTTTNLEKPSVEYIPARIDGETWETCVPARPFIDWLRVTQTKPARTPRPTHRNGYIKPEWVDDQINLTLDEQTQTLKIKAGNTRAEFKCIDAQEFPS